MGLGGCGESGTLRSRQVCGNVLIEQRMLNFDPGGGA